MNSPVDATVNVRYMVDDVQEAVDFYTTHLGFTVGAAFPPAFADALRNDNAVKVPGVSRVRFASGWFTSANTAFGPT